jgi:predicted transcriptional regulator
MARSHTITVRLAPELRAKLDALARDTKRSRSDLAGEAIETYIDAHDWQVAHIRAALAQDREGDPTVPPAEVVRWMESWGTAHELPRPAPKKS